MTENFDRKKSAVVLAGGTGFLGEVLERHFLTEGHPVVVLTRNPKSYRGRATAVAWDGSTLGPWAKHLEGAAAIINLCGKSVDCRYTPANRALLHSSRVPPTQVLGQAIAQCTQPPAVWMNASTATLYRHNLGDTPWTEADTDFTPEPAARDAYSIELAQAWEAAFFQATVPATCRRVALRTTMVLGHGSNSVFPVLRRLATFGLGGKMGSGQQWVSWMHQQDFCQAISWIMTHPELSGIVNLAAPHPERNTHMMALFRQLVRMPVGLPATEWMLELGAYLLRTETELILKSRYVSPARLLQSGYQFAFPTMKAALADLQG
jgi:uncharacterized protein